MPNEKDAVGRAVAATLEAAEKEREEAKLEADLESLEQEMMGDSLPELEDSGLQRVRALLEEFNEIDAQRHKNKVKTEIAKEAGSVEEAKGLLAAKPGIMKRLSVIVKKMEVTLANEEDVRSEMVNWLAMPFNLRHLLAARLKAREPSLDVDDLVERAEGIEEDRRKARRFTQERS